MLTDQHHTYYKFIKLLEKSILAKKQTRKYTFKPKISQTIKGAYLCLSHTKQWA